MLLSHWVTHMKTHMKELKIFNTHERTINILQITFNDLSFFLDYFLWNVELDLYAVICFEMKTESSLTVSAYFHICQPYCRYLQITCVFKQQLSVHEFTPFLIYLAISLPTPRWSLKSYICQQRLVCFLLIVSLKILFLVLQNGWNIADTV